MTIEPVSSLMPGDRSADFQVGAAAPKPTPAELTRAAQQFEAIMVRQLLAPSIEPMMNGNSLGGESGGAGAGGSTYGYMLTDMLSDQITKGGGLGLASVIIRQFQPATPVAQAK